MMKKFRLVMGTNFSACSDNAILYALDLLKPHCIDVHLIFCISDFMDVTDLTDELGNPDFGGDDPVSVHLLEEMYTKKLNAQKALWSSRIKDGCSLQTTLVHGYPEDELVRISIETKADLIVVGASGRPGTLAELMGSKTSDIIKKTSLPVLAVPIKAKLPPQGINSVLYLTDFRETDFISLHQLIEWLPEPNATVHCLHYCHEKPDKWDQKRLEELQLYCTQTYRNQKVVCDMTVGEKKIDDLSKYISINGIQLIGMTRKRRNLISQFFHPDVAHKLLFHAQVPFMLFCD